MTLHTMIWIAVSMMSTGRAYVVPEVLLAFAWLAPWAAQRLASLDSGDE